jgi:hypothetical protein
LTAVGRAFLSETSEGPGWDHDNNEVPDDNCDLTKYLTPQYVMMLSAHSFGLIIDIYQYTVLSRSRLY